MPSQEFSVIIEPGRRKSFYWRDIWRFKGLFFYLAWRDILVRYKQTAIGVLWSVIRPLLTIVVFTLVFNKLGNFPSEGAVPYAIMVCAGMLPWQYFSSAFSESANSLVANSNLLTKVYFPRMIIPASSVITSLVDFAISFVILLGMFIWFRFIPSWHIVFLPFFVLLAFLCAFGVGLYLTAVNVKYRDFRYIIPFIIQFGLYITPVGFSSFVINEKWRMLYSLNPMVGVIDGFRWCILGDPMHWRSFLVSIVITIFFLWAGIYYFRKMEKSFADNI